jgi:hypothetical protein
VSINLFQLEAWLEPDLDREIKVAQLAAELWHEAEELATEGMCGYVYEAVADHTQARDLWDAFVSRCLWSAPPKEVRQAADDLFDNKVVEIARELLAILEKDERDFWQAYHEAVWDVHDEIVDILQPHLTAIADEMGVEFDW